MAPQPDNWMSQFVKTINPSYKQPGNPVKGDWRNLLHNPLGYSYEDYVKQQDAAAAAANGGTSPFMRQLMQQLISGAQNVPGMPNEQEILELARSQVSAQYDPQIAAIRREMGLTKQRAGRNKKELQGLYGELASSYSGDVTASKKSYSGYKNEAKQNLKELQGMLANDYGKALSQQNDEFAELGIEAATPEASAQQKEDLDYLSKLAATEGTAQLDALGQMGAGEETYYREGRGIAQLEGTEAVKDLMSQLSDYLAQRGGDLTTLQGQRTSSIEALRQQLTTQAAQQRSEAQNQTWDRLFKIAGLQNQLDRQGGQQQYSRGLLGASQHLGNELGATRGEEVMGMVHELLGQRPFREGRIKSGDDYIKMTPEQAASYAATYADQQGLAPTEKLALVQSILAYYGRMGG